MCYSVVCKVSPTGLSWRSRNTFSELCASKHLRNTPWWCFLNNTPCTNWYDNALSWSSLFCRIDKWEGMMPCSRYWHTSMYQESLSIMGVSCSTFYILIALSHPMSSYSSYFVFISSTANRKMPWPLMVWTELMSRSYSCNPVIQFAFRSPISCWTSNDLTLGCGTKITQRFFNR